MTTAEVSIETPSGKGAGDENFPVGSWLLPKRLRPHVKAFYDFVRAADDIGDNPLLPPDEKIARLDRFDRAVRGLAAPGEDVPKAERLRQSLAATGVTAQHAVDLLGAFKRDAYQLRYTGWDDLLGYCILSAAPVGRFLLDLHGEDRAGWAASDALCNALQVLNHLQDCGDDYRTLDRVYLPEPWLAAAGTGVTALGAARASPGLRRVLDRTLDETASLLATARRLPFVLKSRGLAHESAAILAIAERLAVELRRRDPLAGRVVLSKPRTMGCVLSGIYRRWRGRW
ncbi:MAG: squalene synthase HpnC [Alphaproteobacteria bacterium]|nr:squalene synthase HpnC [Alphaproteobacteria bacterium]